MTQISTAQSRNAAIDNIRIFLTALVVFHHVAIVYGGSGGWYWKEVEDGSNPLLIFFNAVNQSYFMGFFFLLAGYYTTGSFERKGAGTFLKDRFVRLGVPLLLYFFLLAPFTVGLIRHHEGQSLLEGWWNMVLELEFEPGPLWFAEALLIFALGFVAWRHFFGKVRCLDSIPGPLALALSAIVLGVVSFMVRLWLPVGESILWLQLGYFPCYVFLFIVGCLCSRNKLLETVNLRLAGPWMLVSLLSFCAILWVFFNRAEGGSFSGGWNLNALIYALWDPFLAWGMILGLLWLAGKWFRQSNKVSSWLAKNAYGTYIVHPPIVVWLSLTCSHMNWSPMLKFILVGALSCALSVLVASVLRIIPGSKSVL